MLYETTEKRQWHRNCIYILFNVWRDDNDNSTQRRAQYPHIAMIAEAERMASRWNVVEIIFGPKLSRVTHTKNFLQPLRARSRGSAPMFYPLFFIHLALQKLGTASSLSTLKKIKSFSRCSHSCYIDKLNSIVNISLNSSRLRPLGESFFSFHNFLNYYFFLLSSSSKRHRHTAWKNSHVLIRAHSTTTAIAGGTVGLQRIFFKDRGSFLTHHLCKFINPQGNSVWKMTSVKFFRIFFLSKFWLPWDRFTVCCCEFWKKFGDKSFLFPHGVSEFSFSLVLAPHLSELCRFFRASLTKEFN